MVRYGNLTQIENIRFWRHHLQAQDNRAETSIAVRVYPTAFVETLPPIWHFPSEPKSTGTKPLLVATWSCKFCKMQLAPARKTRPALAVLSLSLLSMLFSFSNQRKISCDEMRTLPPTSPVSFSLRNDSYAMFNAIS